MKPLRLCDCRSGNKDAFSPFRKQQSPPTSLKSGACIVFRWNDSLVGEQRDLLVVIDEFTRSPERKSNSDQIDISRYRGRARRSLSLYLRLSCVIALALDASHVRVIRSGIHFGSRRSHEGLNPSDCAALGRKSRQHVSDIFNRRIKITDAKMQLQNPLSGGPGPPKVSRVPSPPAGRCVDFKSLRFRVHAARAMCAIEGASYASIRHRSTSLKPRSRSR